MQNSTQSTLFILSCIYTRIPTALYELSSIVQQGDILLLLDDGVHALNNPVIHTFNSLMILEQDAYLIPDLLKSKVKCIDYSQFAKLIDQANNVYTWK